MNVDELKNGSALDVTCVNDNPIEVNHVSPPIDVIWTTTDGIPLTTFSNENCLPEIGSIQVSSILSTIEERSRDADYVLTNDTLGNTNTTVQDQLVKSIAFNVCSTETTNDNSHQLPNVNNSRRQRNVILPSGQKQLYEEMVFFGCNLCPFICTKDSKISDHIDSVHRNPEHSYNRLKLKCPGCTNVFHHKLSLRSHLIYDHEVGKSDINKIVNGIVYVSSMMTNENSSRSNENGSNSNENCDESINTVDVNRVSEIQKKQEIDFLQEDENHMSSEEEIESQNNLQITNQTPVLLASDLQNIEQIQLETEPNQQIPEPKKTKKSDKNSNCEGKNNQNEKNILKCNFPNCSIKLRKSSSLTYHALCHQSNRQINGSIDPPLNQSNNQIIISSNLICPECNWQCNSNWRTMQTHLWQEHKVDIDMYKCDECEYRTHSLAKLNNVHRLIHGDARPYLCDDCGKGFKNPKQLRNHKLIHRSRDGGKLSTQTHNCDKCQRTFTDRRQLRIHVQSVHDKIKPYSCNECDYKASSNGALRVHIRQHTGERPFKCDQCEYASSDHNSLRRHRLRHSGVKKYSCPHCSYACIQSSTYKVHMRTKHPGQEAGAVHTCEHCQFRTLSMQKYIVHLAQHETQLTQ